MRLILVAIARVMFWLRRLLALRGWRSVVHASPLKALVACEACESEEATVRVPSEIEGREVWFCEWCYRRWKRANEARAIPGKRRRRPKSKPSNGVRKGGSDGRAA